MVYIYSEYDVQYRYDTSKISIFEFQICPTNEMGDVDNFENTVLYTYCRFCNLKSADQMTPGTADGCLHSVKKVVKHCAILRWVALYHYCLSP